jgi:hypothetical protein
MELLKELIILEDIHGLVKIKNHKMVASAARNDIGSFDFQKVISNLEELPNGFYVATGDKRGRVTVRKKPVNLRKEIQKVKKQVETKQKKFRTKSPGIKGFVQTELMINSAAERKKARTKLFLAALLKLK